MIGAPAERKVVGRSGCDLTSSLTILRFVQQRQLDLEEAHESHSV